jgi:hypothetical protein
MADRYPCVYDPTTFEKFHITVALLCIFAASVWRNVNISRWLSLQSDTIVLSKLHTTPGLPMSGIQATRGRIEL